MEWVASGTLVMPVHIMRYIINVHLIIIIIIIIIIMVYEIVFGPNEPFAVK